MFETIRNNDEKSIALSVDLQSDVNFQGQEFESEFVAKFAAAQDEAALENPNSVALDRHIEWKYSVTRDYDAAVEQSEAYDWISVAITSQSEVYSWPSRSFGCLNFYFWGWKLTLLYI